MSFEALTGTLLDLARALDPAGIPLTVGGGFGLYLKQQHLRKTGERTLLQELPESRATNDIDLFLRVDLLAQLEAMKRVAAALKSLEFTPVDNAKYFQWERTLPGDLEVKIDLLVGPLGDFRSKLKTDKPPRVRPKGNVQLHAHTTEEALEIDTRSAAIALSDRCTDGAPHSTTIYLPQPFTYLMMKLFAFDDRKEDAKKDVGRHHAMDIYRIVAMMTEGELGAAKELSRKYAGDERFQRACRIVAGDFASASSLGMLRLKEHQLFRPELELGEFADVLREIFPG